MNSTMFLSLCSALNFSFAAIVLLKRRNNGNLRTSVFIPLLLSILLYDGIVVSNFLEHSGITDYFDPFEDIAEIVFTFVFLFFVNNWRKNQSEARFRELFRLAPMPLAEIAGNGKIINLNEVFIRKLNEFYGITIDDVPTIGSLWSIAYPDLEYREKAMSTWQTSVDSAYKKDIPIDPEEREFTCRDGSKRTMIISAGVIGTNLLLSMVDITDRKRAEDDREKLYKQLLQAQKLEAIGILAGGVAHDFNNILGTIMGYAELTMEDMGPGDPFRGNIAKILDAAHRSTSLINQLLIFARKQSVTPVLIDMNKAVESMLKLLRRIIGEDIELIWLPAQTLCRVRMDPSQLDQILANLCINARDAIDNIGKITIRVNTVFFEKEDCQSVVDCTPGSYVRLSIIDNGSGMDKETAQHVFEPFFTTKSVGKGTGLGLSTVYGIVKQNNGFIRLYSEPGLGSTFNIFIPHYSDESMERVTQAVEEIPHGRGETILLVEDDPELINMSRLLLNRLGYRVLTASTPGEAIQLMNKKSNEINLILTDVIMPEMNGRELIDHLLLIHPGVKYLFMSGYTADVIISRGVSGAGENFIQKPFSLNQIAVKVREILETAR